MNHKTIYFRSFGYVDGDWIPCEVCGSEAVDIHHIEARGMGGTSNPMKNSIFNLQALCRGCHEDYGDKTRHKEFLKQKHFQTLLTKMVKELGVYQEVNYRENGKIEML